MSYVTLDTSVGSLTLELYTTHAPKVCPSAPLPFVRLTDPCITTPDMQEFHGTDEEGVLRRDPLPSDYSCAFFPSRFVRLGKTDAFCAGVGFYGPGR
jgi:hypothetical protein